MSTGAADRKHTTNIDCVIVAHHGVILAVNVENKTWQVFSGSQIEKMTLSKVKIPSGVVTSRCNDPHSLAGPDVPHHRHWTAHVPC